ncbi:Phosphoethanolamine N-methyltransferase [Penicillium taxi]|uniref:Phosphoethanolamine N-methyltransferase n=1 Tax=Penicillium taxi TaxID=168475 RepID=UPI00254597CF|nr:Phosphoethanolamine N-methyltransferase [Penicillium taxi]KAJ5895681.1 Phosphoethanolamine N-methyltransferase [Penicillium taxi]
MAQPPLQARDIEIDHSAGSSSDFDTIGSDLTSLSESVYSYVYENGRTYHSYRSGSYILPNDEREQVYSISALEQVFGLSNVSDGCNPSSHFGTIASHSSQWRISSHQQKWVPPNLRFVLDDVNQEWMFPSESFDFIHVRGLAGSVEHWPTFLQQCNV